MFIMIKKVIRFFGILVISGRFFVKKIIGRLWFICFLIKIYYNFYNIIIDKELIFNKDSWFGIYFVSFE